MKRCVLTALLSSLSGLATPVESIAADEVATPEKETISTQQNAGRELVCLCNDMWFLLSSVSNRKTADSAAPEMHRLLEQMIVLSDRLCNEGGQDLEMLNEMHVRLEESLEELTNEFNSLCNVRCFGSDKLITEFRYSVEVGMFTDECIALLDPPKPVLSAAEARAEFSRFKRLVEPDKAVLDALIAVQDARSAGDAAVQLCALSVTLNKLAPEQALAERNFAPESRSSARKAYTPIEPLLWGIRSEIVRIASLPGYHKKEFDCFSDALETVFRSLAVTHYHFFDEVFDESFHSDLDEALQENSTTSN